MRPQACLIALRRNRGLSRPELARRLGVAEKVIRYAEGAVKGYPNGEPSEANKRKIADYFDLKATDIWPVIEDEAADKELIAA